LFNSEIKLIFICNRYASYLNPGSMCGGEQQFRIPLFNVYHHLEVDSNCFD
jgi:hypothetical protein